MEFVIAPLPNFVGALCTRENSEGVWPVARFNAKQPLGNLFVGLLPAYLNEAIPVPEERFAEAVPALNIPIGITT
jgi:hypothetical protein